MAIFTITVPKAGKQYTYDTTKLPDVSIHYVTDYGFRQAMVDSTASITKDGFKKPDGTVDVSAMRVAAAKLADQRDAQIRTGAVPGSRVVVDPLAVIAASMGITVDEAKRRLGMKDAEAVVKAETDVGQFLATAKKKAS